MVAHSGHSCSLDAPLAELAALWGVQTAYRDAAGRWRTSPRGAVLQVLESLGAGGGEGLPSGDGGGPMGGREQRLVQRALDRRKGALRDRLLEPVIIAWDGRPPAIGADWAAGKPQIAGTRGGEGVEVTFTLETGEEDRWELTRARTGGSSPVSPTGGSRLFAGPLPFGYHRLRLETRGRVSEATIISAPRRCARPDETRTGRRWGVFAPLYSLPNERSWGAGDLTDLEGLLEAVGKAGGHAVATLPLLATFLDGPFQPAPYAPVSRVFWNEFYLAPELTAEWRESPAAREAAGRVWSSPGWDEMCTAPLVDYTRIMAGKRAVIEDLCRRFFQHADGRRREGFTAFLENHPEAHGYARFRAAVEESVAGGRGGAGERAPAAAVVSWQGGGDLGDLPDRARYHLYCQWQMEEQMAGMSARAGQAGARLFLDLPVGVHSGGYDAWRWRGLFAPGATVGAPPDAFFTRGQDWDCPPLHPERMREQGHRYFADCLRHQMRHARYLRIDHIMSLHRLFWVPAGREPAEGVYVSYPAEGLYAVVCLESHRHGTAVVGEDLGTVPAGVRPAMRRHGVLGTWVLQSALRPRAAAVVGPVPRDVVAGLGTHDMFPFAGFLQGADIAARVETGQLDRPAARRAGAARRLLVARLTAFLGGAGGSPADLLRRAHAHLGASPAALVLANLDDLFLSTAPQNLPGTTSAHDNWCRRVAGSATDVQKAIQDAAAVFQDG